MAFFKKKRPSASGPATVGLYGKHPDAGDFLRLNASGPELQRLDDWLSKALDRSPRLLDNFEHDYASVLSVSFLFQRRGDSSPWSLLGVMAPSQDSSGRRFPLILFSQLDHQVAARHYPALPHEPFVMAAARLLQRRNALDRDQLLEEAQRLAPPDSRSLEAAREAHDQFLDQTGWIGAFSTIFGLAAPMQQGKAVGTLRKAVGALRADAPLPRFGIRCPLGVDPAGHSGMWLALVRRQLPAPAPPDILWSPRSLLVYFTKPSPKALAALLDPQWQDDSLCDLATASAGEEQARLPETDSPLRALLGDSNGGP
jgi:type VI secretion system protein ImpM